MREERSHMTGTEMIERAAVGDKLAGRLFAKLVDWLPKFRTVAELRQELKHQFDFLLPELEIEKPAFVQPLADEKNLSTGASFRGIAFGTSGNTPDLIGREFAGFDALSAELGDMWLEDFIPITYKARYDTEDLKLHVYLGRGPYGAYPAFSEGRIVGELSAQALLEQTDN